jgi:5-methylcytosine-specific restriction endonuclease McrA
VRSSPKPRGTKPRLFVEVGQRIARGVVVDPEIRIPDGHRYPIRGVLLLCDCGNKYETPISKLIGKHASVKSCGCLSREYRASPKKGSRLPDGIAARNAVRDNYKNSTRYSGRVWDLTDEEFDRLTSAECFYCGCSPGKIYRARGNSGEFIYNGIDRVDNALGYTPENVVTACHTCNFAKGSMSFDEFMAWINRLVAHKTGVPGQIPSRSGEVMQADENNFPQ